jgi:hypothetical protein
VFGSPTATLAVVGNTGNPSSEKAGVGGSTPSLATIIPKHLGVFAHLFQPKVQPYKQEIIEDGFSEVPVSSLRIQVCGDGQLLMGN